MSWLLLEAVTEELTRVVNTLDQIEKAPEIAQYVSGLSGRITEFKESASKHFDALADEIDAYANVSIRNAKNLNEQLDTISQGIGNISGN